MPQLSDGLPVSLAPAPTPAGRRAARLSCGTSLVGDFCHACGQHAVTSRLDLRQLRDEVLQQALSLDRGRDGGRAARALSGRA